jgi:hypothetical protein
VSPSPEKFGDWSMTERKICRPSTVSTTQRSVPFQKTGVFGQKLNRNRAPPVSSRPESSPTLPEPIDFLFHGFKILGNSMEQVLIIVVSAFAAGSGRRYGQTIL